MSWGSIAQKGMITEEVDQLGSELSVRLGCPVHYPAYNKNIYECICGVIFPLYLVKTRNWELIIKKHQDERSLVKV